MTSIINAKNTRQEILQARTEKQTAEIWKIYLEQRKNGKKHPQENQHDEHEVENKRS